MFWLVPPSAEDYRTYRLWDGKGRPRAFFGDHVNKCQRVVVKGGMTLFIPPGWIYANYAEDDSVSFAGTFVHSKAVVEHLMLDDLENKVDVS